MADNITIDEGSTTTVSTDDVGGVQVQRVKVQYGVDGAATDVSDTNPMPIDDAGGTITVDDGGTTLSVDDGGGSLTVDVSGTVTVDGSAVTQPVSAATLPLPSGAATAANQTTANGLLTTIDTDTSTIAGAVSGTEMQVDVVTSALPSGAATAALQTSSEAILTTIDADTSALAGCVGGTEIQVDVVGSLPAGTNAIGKLAANSGVDIGDVDVLSLPAVNIARNATSTDGVTYFRDADVDNTAQVLKAAAGLLKGYFIHNPNTTTVYVHFYNVASGSVTVGTTTPNMTFGIPAEQSANLAWEPGIEFSTAITYAATTEADAGATDPTTGLIMTAFYE